MPKTGALHNKFVVRDASREHERLLVLIATFLRYPGVGCADADRPKQSVHHNALQLVQAKMQEVALELGLSWESAYPAVSTIRKDLETLRRYGILDERMYRWGYYLGTGVMTRMELSIALVALAGQAKYQGDAQSRVVYEQLTKRLRGLDLEQQGRFLYPVRQQVDLPIVATDPLEMMAQGKNKDNLFHCMPQLEESIIRGQTIELVRASDPYQHNVLGPMQVIPLQLIYSSIAWYLVYEDVRSGQLAIGRVDRFGAVLRVLAPGGRSIELQQLSLARVHSLLRSGWGLALGNVEDQRRELAGELPLIEVRVRFFQPVVSFILEGEYRHPTQQIRRGPLDGMGKLLYVDYSVLLPPRSIDEFMLFVNRFMAAANILEPMDLAKQHLAKAQALVSSYS
jgi:WYL domain